MSEAPTRRYEVIGRIEEAPDVVMLHIRREEGMPGFRAGQYLTVYFPELRVPEGKAYSISSAPEEPELSITVKRMGEFSNRLCSFRIGDSFTGSDPYGYFFTEEKGTPLVMLGIGIGVTPFRSLIRHYLAENSNREILLSLGNRTMRDVVFKRDFDALASRYPSFRVRHFISREQSLPRGFEEGRMTASRILPFVQDPHDAEFMLCGSISFVRDLWRGLREAGIPEEHIYTEAFFTN